MPRLSKITLYVLFISSFLFLLSSCASPTPIPLSSESSLYVFRFTPPALLEYNPDFNIVREIPLNLPCPLTATHAAPRGQFLALELECANGPLVQVVDTITGEVKTPFTEVDSHYLKWNFDHTLTLRVDALGDVYLANVTPEGKQKRFDWPPAQTYDMDNSPDGQSSIYSLTWGLGHGSELWGIDDDNWLLYADKHSIITFARWSPDGKHIAFILMPDTSTPFPLGELWVMDADGGNARPLAPADAGHGYAAAWSPDSTRIAFVGRDNPDDARADQSAAALVSNIYIVEVATGLVSRVTRFEGSHVESPVWSADGHFLAFSVVTVDDTIAVWIADLASGQVTQLESRGPACCPAWIRK